MKITLRTTAQMIPVALFLLFAVVPWHLLISSGVDLSQMLAAPSFLHPFGTDNLGRDLLVRVAAVIWDAVLPVWIVTMAATLIGYAMGGGLCLLPGVVRDAVRVVLSAGIGVPIGIVVFYFAVLFEVITLGTLLIPLSVLITLRGAYFVLNCYEEDRFLGYWEANRSIGNKEIYRIWKYGFCKAWLRKLMHALGFNLKIVVICEVGLSYLGFGIQEPQASFGNILASHFDSYLNGHFAVLLVITIALWITTIVPEQLLRLLPLKDHRLHAELHP